MCVVFNVDRRRYNTNTSTIKLTGKSTYSNTNSATSTGKMMSGTLRTFFPDTNPQGRIATAPPTAVAPASADRRQQHRQHHQQQQQEPSARGGGVRPKFVSGMIGGGGMVTVPSMVTLAPRPSDFYQPPSSASRRTAAR